MYFDQQQYEMVLMEHKERLVMAQQRQLLREAQAVSAQTNPIILDGATTTVAPGSAGPLQA
jgi:hypothetical protein